MKRFAVVAALALTMVLSYGVSVAFAQDEKAPEGVIVAVTGQNYCLLTTLASDKAADANAAYASLNALKVTEALGVDGNAIAELAGKTLHYIPTKEAEPLLVGEENQGLTVTVQGKVFQNENALLVESFEQEFSEDAWDELPVGSKSQQQVL